VLFILEQAKRFIDFGFGRNVTNFFKMFYSTIVTNPDGRGGRLLS